MRHHALFVVLLLILMTGGGRGLTAQIVIKAERLHPVSGPAIPDAVIVVEGGKIRAVGPASMVPVPLGARVLEARVVTPGLIDAHSVVGLAGYLNQEQDSDQLDQSAPMQPELRALDAYNARERLVRWLRELGVTTLHTGLAPGALIPGQTMVIKTAARGADEALVPEAMVSIVLGEGQRGADGKAPGNPSKAVAMLRARLLAAQRYAKERAASPDDTSRDLGLEVLADLLAGKKRALVTAHRVRDIETALRLKEEFGFEMILDGGAEAYRILERLKEAKVSVVLHATRVRTNGELANATMTSAAKLAEAGIPFAFQSGYEGYVPKTRVVLFEAATAVRYGLSDAAALKALTLDAARLLGLDDRIGSVEMGKDADLVLFDGDPFELTTKVQAVLIDGVPVSTTPR